MGVGKHGVDEDGVGVGVDPDPDGDWLAADADVPEPDAAPLDPDVAPLDPDDAPSAAPCDAPLESGVVATDCVIAKGDGAVDVPRRERSQPVDVAAIITAIPIPMTYFMTSPPM